MTPRAKWDLRFLRLAREVASWSKDPSTQVGAVLVSPDRYDVIFGYNGFPHEIEDSYDRLHDRDEKLDRIIHAEENAVLNAKRSVKGYTLYTWPFMTCDKCAIRMIRAGVERFIAPVTPDDIAVRWSESIRKAKSHIHEAKKPLIFYSMEDVNDCSGFDS